MYPKSTGNYEQMEESYILAKCSCNISKPQDSYVPAQIFFSLVPVYRFSFLGNLVKQIGLDSLAIFCFFSNIGHPGGLFS